MFIVRGNQFDAMARASLPEWLESHLRKHFGEQCEQLGEARLRKEILHGMERAWSHGFRSGVHTARYLDLMFTFGRDFDQNDTLGWPPVVFHDASARDPEATITDLLEAARKHLEALAPSGISD